MPGVAYKLNNENAQKIEDHVLRRLERAAEMVVSAAKLRCPVDTGNLRNSIEWGRIKDGVIVGTVVEYSIYQELGFTHRGGGFVQNAFLLPGLLAVKDEIGARLA